MFVHSRSKAVEAFTPPALPGFSAIPASIPSHPSFAALRFTVVRHTRQCSTPAKNLMASLVRSCSLCVARCCLRPRSGKPSLVSSAMAFVACVYHKGIGPPEFHHDNGANYQIQRLTLHLATSAQLRVSPPSLGVEFPHRLFRLPDGFLVTP